MIHYYYVYCSKNKCLNIYKKLHDISTLVILICFFKFVLKKKKKKLKINDLAGMTSPKHNFEIYKCLHLSTFWSESCIEKFDSWNSVIVDMMIQ